MPSAPRPGALALVVIMALVGRVLADNYCGTDFGDARKCQTMCPGAVDSECPDGETCFGDVPCPSTSSVSADRYCGTDFGAASECQSACPGGLDTECPDGETCFDEVCFAICTSPSPTPEPPQSPPPSPADSVRPTVEPSPTDMPDNERDSRFCGKDHSSSLACALACASGSDGECPDGETCFEQIRCTGSPPPSVPPDPTKGGNGETPQQSGGQPRLARLEIVGIVAGVIASMVTVEETIRRCWWKRRSRLQGLPGNVDESSDDGSYS